MEIKMTSQISNLCKCDYQVHAENAVGDNTEHTQAWWHIHASMKSVIIGSGNEMAPSNLRVITWIISWALRIMIQWNFNQSTKALFDKTHLKIMKVTSISSKRHLWWHAVVYLYTCCHYICFKERPALLWAMAWWWFGNGPWSELQMTNILGVIYVIVTAIYMLIEL